MKRAGFIGLLLATLPAVTPEHAEKLDLLGKISPGSHHDFAKVSREFGSKDGLYLRVEVYEAFKDMFFDAKRCGIKLEIISATRTFDHQASIWTRKWNSTEYGKFIGADRCRRIMRFSSMPGTSRHHWGTDIDLNSLENSYFDKGEGAKVYAWLCRFGPDYGFSQTYTSKSKGRTGYEEEKWHWSYRPVADSLHSKYRELVGYADITGFPGSEYAQEVGCIELYVNGVE